MHQDAVIPLLLRHNAEEIAVRADNEGEAVDGDGPWRVLSRLLTVAADEVERLTRERNGVQAEVEKLRAEVACLQAEAACPSASEDALDDILLLCRAKDSSCPSEWEYPGQVVRDVALALGMTMEQMVKVINPEPDPTPSSS